MKYPTHAAANSFPMFGKKLLESLMADIRENGQREPIKLYAGAVLDGRNRLAACAALGLAPKTETLPDDVDPWAYVWSLNGERRDLVNEQRYLIWQYCHEQSTAWQAERARLRGEANQKRAEKAKAQHAASNPRKGETLVGEQSVPLPEKQHVERRAKASEAKVDAGAVQRGDKLAKERPDLAAQVRAGELKPAEAHRQMKRAELVAALESIAGREVKRAQGLYDAIVIDPPWEMEKIERDERPAQVGFDYPTMNEQALLSLDIPCAKDCHVWLWATHKHLPLAFRLLDAWGLKYVCAFVWHKPGGFQPYGLPQYNCEFALYARKGAPQFVDTKAFPVCFEGKRGKHSEKPEEFYEVVRRVTAGRRLDMFNRRLIAGFDGHGKEAQ